MLQSINQLKKSKKKLHVLVRMNLILFSAIVFFVVIGFFSNVDASPFFPEQNNVNAARYFPEDEFNDNYSEALILEGAFYESNGETLDARLIIHGTSGFVVNNTLSYGMLIDSDSDFDTGKNGFDYRYKVTWNNNTWTEIYERIQTDSLFLKEISADQIEDPFIKDSIEGGKQSVELSLDLHEIGDPELYAIAFFTEGSIYEKTPRIQYVTSLAVIPPPEFVVRTNPSPIAFESSTENVFHILVESDIAETTDVHFNVYSDDKTLQITELIDSPISMKGGKAEIPVLLSDDGYDEFRIYKLFVDLNPWHAVNPETRNAERGGEIFESYHYRNSQKSETFTIFWSSFPQQPFINAELLVQIILLVATGVMVFFGIWTHFDNRKDRNQERKIGHSLDMAKIYKTMQSLVCVRDYYSKNTALRYPDDKIAQQRVRLGDESVKNDGSIILKDLNQNNLPHLGWALQHIDQYPNIKTRWDNLQQSIKEYDELVDSLKNKIKSICLKNIGEKLDGYKEYDGTYSNSYFITNIVFECYEILVDDANGSMHQPASGMMVPWNFQDESDTRELCEIRADYVLFQSPEPIDESIAQEILDSCITNETRGDMKKIIKKFSKSTDELALFKQELKSLVTLLEGRDLIKGKCNLGI